MRWGQTAWHAASILTVRRMVPTLRKQRRQPCVRQVGTMSKTLATARPGLCLQRGSSPPPIVWRALRRWCELRTVAVQTAWRLVAVEYHVHAAGGCCHSVADRHGQTLGDDYGMSGLRVGRRAGRIHVACRGFVRLCVGLSSAAIESLIVGSVRCFAALFLINWLLFRDGSFGHWQLCRCLFYCNVGA